MYTVKANDHGGRAVSFACGTPEQALERMQELTSRGFDNVRLTDLKGKEWNLGAFERSRGDEGR